MIDHFPIARAASVAWREYMKNGSTNIWLQCRTVLDVQAANAADLAALNSLRLAFYLDTQDGNTFEDCMLMQAHDILGLL